MQHSNNRHHADSNPWIRYDSPDVGAFRLIPAAYTPLHADGSLDYAAVEPYAAQLVRHGVRQVFVNGTTGEGLSLTVDERMAMVEAWARHREQLEPIVHVGHNCQAECIRMAAHAQQLGLRLIAAMSTCFFRPTGEQTMVDFLAPIAAAAPDTRLYYYHMPSMTGMSLDMDQFIAAAVERIPNFAGVKYTHEDLPEFERCRQKWSPKIDLLFGRDELLLEALAVGAEGAVGSYYSLIPHVFRQMVASHRQGDSTTAKACAEYAVRYITLSSQYIQLPASKFLLAQLGIGSGAVRAPLTTLSAADGQALLRQLAELGPPPANSAQQAPAPHQRTPKTPAARPPSP